MAFSLSAPRFGPRGDPPRGEDHGAVHREADREIHTSAAKATGVFMLPCVVMMT